MMDVTPDETHYTVQCEDIRLISSVFNPIIGDEEKNSRFTFRIKAVVEEQKAYSYLEVQVNYYSANLDDVQGFQLTYVLMGTFGAHQKMQPQDLSNFVKMYTLSILWPYAREYATDQLRRAGINEVLLPIINPQVVTEKIVENNLVEVEIVKKE